MKRRHQVRRKERKAKKASGSRVILWILIALALAAVTFGYYLDTHFVIHKGRHSITITPRKR